MYSLLWQLFWWIWHDFVLLALLLRVEQRTDLRANMCTGSQVHLVSLLPPNHFPRGVIDGSFTRAISPKIHLFLLSSSKLLEQFQTSLSAAFFYERCLHSEPAFCGFLDGAFGEECQACWMLWRLLFFFFFSPCRRTEALWFPNWVNMKHTKLAFRQKRTWSGSRGFTLQHSPKEKRLKPGLVWSSCIPRLRLAGFQNTLISIRTSGRKIAHK